MSVKLDLTPIEEHTSRVFDNRTLRRIFRPKRKWWKAGKYCNMWSFITCTIHQILLG